MVATTAKQGSRSEHRSAAIGRGITYVLLLLGSVLFMLPFLYLLGTGMKTAAETSEFPPKLLPKTEVTTVVDSRSVPVQSLKDGRTVAAVKTTADGVEVQPLDADLRISGAREVVPAGDLKDYSRVAAFRSNLRQSLTMLPFRQFLWNTLIIVFFSVLGGTLSAALCGYGFARVRFRGREPLFIILLATMMIPGQVTMIPVYILFKELRWIDTFLPLIVPAWFGGGAFSIFLLRQFFRQIPYEMEEAAKIDGCSPLATWWRIVLPLSFPALATVSIFSFMGAWNDYMGPLIYINDTSKYTLALGLSLFKGQYGVDTPHLMMAATLVVLLPVLILFFFAQKHFIQGIVVSGVKG